MLASLGVAPSDRTDGTAIPVIVPVDDRSYPAYESRGSGRTVETEDRLVDHRYVE